MKGPKSKERQKNVEHSCEIRNGMYFHRHTHTHKKWSSFLPFLGRYKMLSMQFLLPFFIPPEIDITSKHTAEQMTKSFPFQHEFFNTKSMLWYFSFDLLINEQIVACWTNFLALILSSSVPLFWRVSLEIRVLQMTARTHHTMHCLDFHSLTN